MKTNSKDKITGLSALLLAAFIWGTAFVAQISGMESVGPYTFNCLRSLLASIVLFLFIFIKTKIKKNKIIFNKKVLIGGLLSGVILFIATTLQQLGLLYTSASKGGFITSLYILFVPVLGLFIKKRVKLITWILVLIALIGFYLLLINVNESFSFGKGEMLIFFSSIFFSIQMLIIDYFVKDVDCVYLSMLQFFIVFVLSIVPMLIFDVISINGLKSAAGTIIYAGILSSCVAYTLQIYGQKKIEATLASLVLSLESVFALLAGVILLQEKLITKEIIGCILIFVSVVLSQVCVKTKPIL